MIAPRNPGIYIGMMSLVMTAVLAGSSLIAPCIEIGFFWTAAATALAVACYARRTSVQIGQSGMLMVYCLLAGALSCWSRLSRILPTSASWGKGMMQKPA